jgi:thioredoxin-related protein
MFQKFLFSLFLIFSLTVGKAQGIQFFEGSWQDALAKAQAEDKLLFVDAFAKWCGPCKAMAKNVFTQAQVGEFFNSNFINLKLDMEETDGVTFGHKYPVQAYPTLFFIDGDGKVVKTIKGGQTPEGLVSLGNEAMKKLDRSVRYEAKYAEGDRSFDLMYNYVKALNAAGKPSLKISNEYLASNPSLSENERLKFILEAAVESDSKLFDQVLANKSKIEKLVGKELYIEKTKSACAATVKKAIEFEMEPLFIETIDKADKAFPEDFDAFKAESDMKYYGAMKNDDKYAAAYKKMAKIGADDAKILKNIVTDIIKHHKDNKKMVTDAVEYAGEIYGIKDDMESLTQYCSMLMLNNDVDKALKTVTKAREKAEKSGGDLTQYDGLLNFLKSKKS